MSNYIENSGMHEQNPPAFGSAPGNNFTDANTERPKTEEEDVPCR